MWTATYSLCGISSTWARTPGGGDTTKAATSSTTETWTAAQQQHAPPATNIVWRRSVFLPTRTKPKILSTAIHATHARMVETRENALARNGCGRDALRSKVRFNRSVKFWKKIRPLKKYTINLSGTFTRPVRYDRHNNLRDTERAAADAITLVGTRPGGVGGGDGCAVHRSRRPYCECRGASGAPAIRPRARTLVNTDRSDRCARARPSPSPPSRRYTQTPPSRRSHPCPPHRPLRRISFYYIDSADRWARATTLAPSHRGGGHIPPL